MNLIGRCQNLKSIVRNFYFELLLGVASCYILYVFLVLFSTFLRAMFFFHYYTIMLFDFSGFLAQLPRSSNPSVSCCCFGLFALPPCGGLSPLLAFSFAKPQYFVVQPLKLFKRGTHPTIFLQSVINTRPDRISKLFNLYFFWNLKFQI